MTDSASEMLNDSASDQVDDSAGWYGEVDQDTQGYIANKQWKGTGDVIQSYRNLEKMLGADRAGRTLVLPKEGEDKTEFYTKLGRPESADKYEFGEVSGNAVDWFRGKAFEMGLNQEQAKTLIEGFSELTNNISNENSESQAVEFQNQMNDLKREWGSAYDTNINAAKKATQQFGFSSEDIDAMENALGPKKLFERLSSIGRALSEDSFVTGQRHEGFIMSPAEAAHKIQELRLDDNFMSKYMNSDKNAIEKFSNLMKLAYPE